MQLGCWKELEVHHIVWLDGELLANRMAGEVCELLDKSTRRLAGSWSDVTAEFAIQAIDLASHKLTIPTFSHRGMLEKIRAIRRAETDAAIRASGLEC